MWNRKNRGLLALALCYSSPVNAGKHCRSLMPVAIVWTTATRGGVQCRSTDVQFPVKLHSSISKMAFFFVSVSAFSSFIFRSCVCWWVFFSPPVPVFSSLFFFSPFLFDLFFSFLFRLLSIPVLSDSDGTHRVCTSSTGNRVSGFFSDRTVINKMLSFPANQPHTRELIPFCRLHLNSRPWHGKRKAFI